VIDVSVREKDAADWSAQALRCFADAGSRTGNAGVDQGETIVFPDQKTIDHAEASQADKILGFLNKLHTEPRETLT
jgi:hypothetical protein